MKVYYFHPKIPCIGIFVFCIVIHLIVALYGSFQVVWYPIVYGFMMTILYIFALVLMLKRSHILCLILIVVLAILLFVLFLFFVMSIVMTIDQPVLGKDIVYEMFPQNGNYVETYQTLSIAFVASSLILLIINTIGLLALLYALFYFREYEDSQDVAM